METPGISPESAAKFRMIDIGKKSETQRRAVASGSFFASIETISRIRERSLPKGDVLILAEVAGIQGAKRTSDLLPLCHPLSLTSVRVWSEVGDTQIKIFCEAKTVGKTGVEMEALCGVNAALLCIYDLTKGIDPVLSIGEIRLELKEGGKSGTWTHPKIELKPCNLKHSSKPPLLQDTTAVVITLSDRCSLREYEDESGPVATQWLKAQGSLVKTSMVLPDDSNELKRCLLELLENRPPHLIVTTGGTGLSKRDITPETVLKLACELKGREIPGIGEVLRQDGAKYNRNSWLSRSTAVLIKNTLIVCLPGNPSAVSEGLDAIGTLMRHAIHVGAGGTHEHLGES